MARMTAETIRMNWPLNARLPIKLAINARNFVALPANA